mmetsp:Transcript_108308/g.183354  ORF Transcript_108308/g.183354 Transcript_108308/m.183354 type:complete len:152 (-) Transcript_108308:957-1412(-)
MPHPRVLTTPSAACINTHTRGSARITPSVSPRVAFPRSVALSHVTPTPAVLQCAGTPHRYIGPTTPHTQGPTSIWLGRGSGQPVRVRRGRPRGAHATALALRILLQHLREIAVFAALSQKVAILNRFARGSVKASPCPSQARRAGAPSSQI